MADKSRYQQEFDALPGWAQKMVRALAGLSLISYGNDKAILACLMSDTKNYRAMSVGFKKESFDDWCEGLDAATDLARALTAPWPRPTGPPHNEMTTNNIVEMVHDYDDDEGGGFDQPCHFGNRCGYHAVYCHNEAWPNAPRKCRRNRGEFKHEDCPGFVPNAGYVEPQSKTESER